MKKNIRKILLTINIIFGMGVLWAAFFPINENLVEFSNTDVNGTLVHIGSITNNRKMELEYCVYDKKLSGIDLFFCVESKENNNNGKVICTFKYNDDVILRETVNVKELNALNVSGINAKNFEVKHDAVSSGIYTLTLEGDGISRETRVSLYGNRTSQNYLQCTDELQNYYTPLYMIEVQSTSHPYIWYMLFLLALSMMISYVIYIDQNLKDKEKKIEK